MKLLLDMYKGVGKETRDKTQLMAAERKARLEIDDLKQQLKKMQASSESKREDSFPRRSRSPVAETSRCPKAGRRSSIE